MSNHPTPTVIHNAKCLLLRGSLPEWVAKKTGLTIAQVREIKQQMGMGVKSAS